MRTLWYVIDRDGLKYIEQRDSIPAGEVYAGPFKSITAARRNAGVQEKQRRQKFDASRNYFMGSAKDARKCAFCGLSNLDHDGQFLYCPMKNPRKRLSQAEMLKNPSDILSGKSIQTEYFGPGNIRGSRIKAGVVDGNKIQKTMSFSYRDELDSYGNHIAAAEALRDKMGWSGDLIGIGTRKGYVFGFKKFALLKTASGSPIKNPTIRARKARSPSAARRHAAMFDTDKQSSERKHIYVQRKDGAMWITLAVAKHTQDGIAKARSWADRFHRKNPGSTLRIFV